MIRNDKQLKISQNHLNEFRESLRSIEATEGGNEIRKSAHLNAIRNDIQKLEKEIHEYEELKGGKKASLNIPELRLCHEALIKARIAKGWTQAELAEKVGLKEQQIQRYEASDYSTASLPRIDEIIYALGISVSLHVTGLAKHNFALPEDISEKEAAAMESKAMRNGSLLALQHL